MTSRTRRSVATKLTAAAASLALVGMGVSIAQAAEGPFELVAYNNSDTGAVESVKYELFWTDADGEKSKVVKIQELGPVDTTRYPAGTRLEATIVMQPTYKISKLNVSNLPLSVGDFTVTAVGVGNDGQLTYKASKVLAGNDPKTAQRFTIYGVNAYMFDHVGFNLNGGSWQPGTFQKGDRLYQNQQFVTPLTPIVKPADPVRAGYTFLGWSGWSEISGSRVDYPITSDPYSFTEVAPLRPDGEKLIANFKAEWGRLGLTKTVRGSSLRKAGETITYTLTATNDSAAPLTDLKFDDPKLDTSNCPTQIAPNSKVECTIPYVVTQADIDSGSVKNTATASAKVNDQVTLTSKEARADHTLIDMARLSLIKTVTPVAEGTKPGQQVDYVFEVANKGNVTLDQIKVDDPKISDVTCGTDKLAPGESVKCTGKYTLTQADVDAGEVQNTAKATAKTPVNERNPNGKDVSSDASSATLTIAAKPELTLTKAGVAPDSVVAGDKISYTFTVVNAGNVTVDSVAVNDPKIANVSCQATQLAADAATTCTGEYTITQADIDAGKVDNAASANGKDPKGAGVQSPEATVSVALKQEPKLELTKTASPTSDVTAGDTITYTFSVTNSGNVTVTKVSINDAKIANVSCENAELAPGAQTTCTGTYQVTQADVDAGEIVNTATATGADPQDKDVKSAEATATVTPKQEAKLELTKTAAQTANVMAGEKVDYSFTVKNAGNLSLTDITVNDPLITSVTCAATNLEPGKELSCTGQYEISEADVKAGKVVNTATASGKAPKGEPVESNEATVIVTTKAKETPTPTPSPTPTETPKPTPTGTETPKPVDPTKSMDPTPSNSQTTKPVDPTPTTSQTTKPVDPTPTTSQTTKPVDPTQTISQSAKPTGQASSTPASAKPTDPKPSNSADGAPGQQVPGLPTGPDGNPTVPGGYTLIVPEGTDATLGRTIVAPEGTKVRLPGGAVIDVPAGTKITIAADAKIEFVKPDSDKDKSNKRGLLLPKTGSSQDMASLFGAAAILSLLGAGALARRRRD